MHSPRFLIPALALTVLAGCAGHHRHDGPSARAALEPTRGNSTRGVVMFHQQGDAVLVHTRVSGLKPGQEHGFHVHEKGDCSSGDGMSTGGHFNPLGKPHGHHAGAEKHAGDLPMLKGDAQGNADMKFTVRGITIGSGVTDIVGKGLIVHAQPDDWTTQPTGNAGARIACAVIERAAAGSRAY
jgi:Cu-Zn family superoxide dismutase